MGKDKEYVKKQKNMYFISFYAADKYIADIYRIRRI